MRNKIFLIICLVAVEFASFIRWRSCWIFSDSFYFTKQTLANRLLLSSNPESGFPILFVRALHNKLTEFASGYLLTLLQYIDIRFLMEFIGIAGALGVYLGIWYMITKKTKNIYMVFMFILLIIASSLEIIFNPHIRFFEKLIPFALIFCSFSLYGWWNTFTIKYKKTIFMFFFIILIISVLSLVFFPNSEYLVCLRA